MANILQQFEQRITKLNGDIQTYKIPCYVSATVVNECTFKINSTYNFVGINLSNFLKNTILAKGILYSSPISSINVRIIETFFLNLKKPQGSLNALLDKIEFYIVTKLESLRLKQPNLDFQSFMIDLVADILSEVSQIRILYDSLVLVDEKIAKKVNTSYDPNTVKTLEGYGLEYSDATHIASVYSYQNTNKIKSVFVTTDKVILTRNSIIYNTLKVNCCDPIYAIHC